MNNFEGLSFGPAAVSDFDSIREFYWNLIERMADQSDVIGWKKGIYPTDAFLKESIAGQELFLLTTTEQESIGRRIIGSVIVNSACNEGYDGVEWSQNLRADEVMIPHALGVDPACQGQGIGRIFVSHILEMAKSRNMKAVRLDILGANRAAERLYTGMGFRFAASKKMFYEDTGWTDYWMYELNF